MTGSTICFIIGTAVGVIVALMGVLARRARWHFLIAGSRNATPEQNERAARTMEPWCLAIGLSCVLFGVLMLLFGGHTAAVIAVSAGFCAAVCVLAALLMRRAGTIWRNIS